MAETPEIPEAKDEFEKFVAVSIAVFAIALSIIAAHGDDAKTNAILKTSKESDQWSFYQAKSIKRHLAESQRQMFAMLETAKPASMPAGLEQDLARYGKEQDTIKAQAESLGKQAEHFIEVNERCDQGALVVQIAIVLLSVAILTRMKAFWFAGLAAGVVGAAVGLSSFFV